MTPDCRTFFGTPIYALPDHSRFAGIYSTEQNYDAWSKDGVTSQFLDNAATYHQKYIQTARWEWLLSRAFERIGVPKEPLSILDVGSGSGNSVFPLLKLFPASSIVATDISPPLLAILRDHLDPQQRARTLLLSVDVGEAEFAAGSFDLVVGAAILHHILNPAKTISACAKGLKAGGHALFYEPFEAGSVILALIYDQLIARSAELQIPDVVTNFLRAYNYDVKVRTGSDKSADIFKQIDDKWLFNRTYFQEQADRVGLHLVDVFSIDSVENQFSRQLTTHLRLGIGAGPEVVPEAVWDLVRRYDTLFSDEVRKELLLEGCVVFRRPGGPNAGSDPLTLR